MKGLIAAMMLVAAPAAPAASADVALPSGRVAVFVDLITDHPGPAGLTFRYRFLAPGIARDDIRLDIGSVAADMDWLCSEFALKNLPATGPAPSQIIISMSDRPVEFGAATPDATQFFEAYSILDNTCVWEGF